MRTRFTPGTETLCIPFGTPRPLPFHDGELGLDLAVRGRGFVTVEAPEGEAAELRSELRRAAAAALEALLKTGTWTWAELEGKGLETLEEAMEEALAGTGRKASVAFDRFVPDDASAEAIREKRAAEWAGRPIPTAPVDSPMIDGPGAYPQGPGGFGLYRMGETPSLPLRTCPGCGSAEPPEANFCTQCGAKLPR